MFVILQREFRRGRLANSAALLLLIGLLAILFVSLVSGVKSLPA